VYSKRLLVVQVCLYQGTLSKLIFNVLAIVAILLVNPKTKASIVFIHDLVIFNVDFLKVKVEIGYKKKHYILRQEFFFSTLTSFVVSKILFYIIHIL
jgi:hypothetical protein